MASAFPTEQGQECFILEMLTLASESLETISKEANFSPRIDVIVNVGNGTISVVDSGPGLNVAEIYKWKAETRAAGEHVRLGTCLQVADFVVVHSKHNDNDQFTLVLSPSVDGKVYESYPPKLIRGTKVVVHLKPDHLDFLETAKIGHLIQQYSIGRSSNSRSRFRPSSLSTSKTSMKTKVKEVKFLCHMKSKQIKKQETRERRKNR